MTVWKPFRLPTNLAKLCLQRAASQVQQHTQPLVQRIANTAPVRRIARATHEVLETLALYRYAQQTLDSCGYYEQPRLYAALPLQELLPEEHDLPASIQIGQERIPLENLYVIVAEYRYCVRVFAATVETLVYPDGRREQRGSSPLLELIRPISSTQTEWSVAEHGTGSKQLEQAVLLALERIQTPHLKYENTEGAETP